MTTSCLSAAVGKRPSRVVPCSLLVVRLRCGGRSPIVVAMMNCGNKRRRVNRFAVIIHVTELTVVGYTDG